MPICNNCGKDVDASAYDVDEELCEDCMEQRDFCHACSGTGIGQGDPNTSRCQACGGSGSKKTRRDRERDDMDRADYEYDRMKDERAERAEERNRRLDGDRKDS
jgi:hypothetical protein